MCVKRRTMQNLTAQYFAIVDTLEIKIHICTLVMKMRLTNCDFFMFTDVSHLITCKERSNVSYTKVATRETCSIELIAATVHDVAAHVQKCVKNQIFKMCTCTCASLYRHVEKRPNISA
jgi:hypothetical protein